MIKRRGFTLIEAMIAITVFSIGVLAVMRVITQNISSMDKVEARTTATFLAKEGLELVYNMRESNLEKSLPRNCLLTDQNLFVDNYTRQTEGNVSSFTWELDPKAACSWYFSSGAIDHQLLLVSFAPEGYTISKPIPVSTGDALFAAARLSALHSLSGDAPFSWYGLGSGEETVFARYILFTGLVADGQILPLQKLLKVSSHVLYRKGSNVGEVVLESVIGGQ